MAGLYSNDYLTNDFLGEDPKDTTRYPMFKLKWKNAGCVSADENYIPGTGSPTISGSFVGPKIRKWAYIKAMVKRQYSGAIRVTYFDGEGDEIPVESQCEFEELLKYCENKDSRSVDLIIEKCSTPVATDTKKNTKNCQKDNTASSKKTASHLQQPRSAMAPARLDDCGRELGKTVLQSQLNYNGTQPEGSGDTAPKWFTNYMQTMKDEIVTEVSKRVTKTVMDALSKKRESQYDFGTSHSHASDTECLLDSDLDDRVSLAEQVSSNSSENREKKVSDTWSRSGAHRLESSRRRHRHGEKQRKKHSKNHGFQTPNPDEIRHSPSFNRHRGEKGARNKREVEAARELSQRTARPKLISPVDSTFMPEVPLLKLRLASPYNGQGADSKSMEEKLRMGCSVTGQDLLEKPNDRVPEYCALSDSDNISIISDVSHNSDVLQINNSFEMILQPSSTFPDEAENDRSLRITTEFQQSFDDPDNARDSSSFELLSEPPPSPPLSIHIDEDHFAPGENETSNYNINDEMTIDKRGNQSKIDKCPYAIDAHGKMYQQNIMDGDEECADIILEKRTGGAYSFVGEALPASTKESMIFPGRSDSSADHTYAASGVCKDAGVEEATEETPPKPQSRGNGDYVFYEWTQSFHSHTAQPATKDRQDCAGFQSTEVRTEAAADASCSNAFVDHNASKGLGDTKRTSPRKQSSTRNKSSEDCRSEQPRSNRKSSHDSHGSGNRNSSRHESSKRFGNWSTTRSSRMMDDFVFNAVDPMHILPETLVTGAVHVASSAYSTARRIYDKVLATRTRKPADRSQSKFGRR